MTSRLWAIGEHCKGGCARFASMLSCFLSDTKGATAIEYGLIVGGISVAIVAVVFNLGEDLDNLFQLLMNKFTEGN